MRLSGDASKRPPILSGVRVARAGSRADPRAQSLAVAPAAGQHCAVLQVHARIASVQRLDRGHLIEVGDVAAVDAGEAGRIELGLDARSEERRVGKEGGCRGRTGWWWVN